MVNNLRDLMVGATSSAPDDHFLAAEVLAAGRGRVRRRRIVAGAGTVGVAATAAVALASLSMGGNDKADPVPPVDHVVHVQQAGPVLQLSDAVQGTEGKDYVVLATNNVARTGQADGLSFRALLGGGQILVADGQPFHDVRRWGLLAGTHPVRWMPTVPGEQPARFLGESSQGYVFEGTWDRETLPLWTLHPFDESWDRIDIGVSDLGPISAVGGVGFELGAGRIWGSVVSEDGTERLYSHPLTPGGSWTYIADAGSYAVNDWGLLYLDPEGQVHARTLGGRQDDVLDLPADQNCDVSQLSAGANRAAVTLTCDPEGGRTLVLGLDRTLLATVVSADSLPTNIEVGADFVVLNDDGVYAADLTGSRVLRLSDDGVPGSTRARLIRWSSFSGDGRQEFVADFR